MSEDLRNKSRRAWNDNGKDTIEMINCGSFMRIADAVETMAKGWANLERRALDAERSRDFWRQEAGRMERKLRATRGQVTKMRKRQEGK